MGNYAAQNGRERFLSLRMLTIFVPVPVLKIYDTRSDDMMVLYMIHT